MRIVTLTTQMFSMMSAWLTSGFENANLLQLHYFFFIVTTNSLNIIAMAKDIRQHHNRVLLLNIEHDLLGFRLKRVT
jgi:hypothetical protein